MDIDKYNNNKKKNKSRLGLIWFFFSYFTKNLMLFYFVSDYIRRFGPVFEKET